MSPQEVWPNPTPEEQKAYDEFVRAWNADDEEYRAHYRQWLQEESECEIAGEMVRALAYGCVSRGTDSSRGHCFTQQIGADSYDGHYDVFGADETEVRFGYEAATDYHAWFRFYNVSIPQGVTINYAKLTLKAKTSSPSQSGSLYICCEDADTASNPPVTYADGQNKPRTDQRATWNISQWTADSSYDTANFACSVQEVVDRTGWSSSAALMVFIDPIYGYNTWFEAYDHDSPTNHGATLEVWWNQTVAEVPSGGAQVGGSADQWLGNEPMRGGIVVGGCAAFTFDEQMSGGATLGGSASVLRHSTIVCEGGILAGGEASVLSGIFMKGGVQVGGSCRDNTTANEQAQGGVLVGMMPVFPNGYIYRAVFDVPPEAVEADLEKFHLPLTVQLDPNKVDGNWLVTDTSDSVLYHELRSYNATTGRVHLYVKEDLNTTSNTIVYLYYNRG